MSFIFNSFFWIVCFYRRTNEFLPWTEKYPQIHFNIWVSLGRKTSHRTDLNDGRFSLSEDPSNSKTSVIMRWYHIDYYNTHKIWIIHLTKYGKPWFCSQSFTLCFSWDSQNTSRFIFELYMKLHDAVPHQNHIGASTISISS